MTDPRTREFWLAQFNRIKGLREEDGAEALARLGHPLAPDPTRVRLGRRRLVPAVLHRGLTGVNRLRQVAAEAIHQRSARTATVPLAPATAWRKHRGRATSAFPSTYPTARGVLHAPAWCLPRLDELGAQALMTWTMTMLGTHSAAQSAAAVQIPDLTLRAAVLIGSVTWPGGGAVALTLLLEHAADLGLSAPQRAFVRALRHQPAWRARLRRCPYDAGRTEGCYRYFFDRSPAGTARACSPAHAVRLAESRPDQP